MSVLLFAVLFGGPVFGLTPQEAATRCFQIELNLWESVRGRLPTDDEADLIVDVCMLKYEEAKNEQSKSK